MSTVPVEILTVLSSDQADAVRRLAATAAEADGTEPLNEAALLQVHQGRTGVTHLLAHDEAALVGYAQLNNGTASVGQLIVHPGHRRRGVGRALVEQLIEYAEHPLQVWAVGDSPAAQALARKAGLTPQRELLIMQRRLDGTIPEATPRPPVTIRSFVPGQDEKAWLAVNASAFADHPEQGSMTEDDLAQRMAEPWFDAGGFFVATVDEAIVGFHWTKQHQDHLGEVYVLGIAPEAAGQGLGKALLLTGLHYLRGAGNTMVELYVEADNPAAVGLYRAYGFAPVSRDVMYAAA